MRTRKRSRWYRFAKGISLIELTVTLLISTIPISSVGVLLIGGQRSWHRSYLSANRPTAIRAQQACGVFERVGRKSDSSSSILLPSGSSDDTEALKASVTDIMQNSKSVEFHYWPSESKNRRIGPEPMEMEYARFYLESDSGEFKVDYGPYPHEIDGRVIVTTAVLATNVTDVQFKRTVLNNVAQGCVRMTLMLTDPADDKKITIMAATLMHN